MHLAKLEQLFTRHFLSVTLVTLTVAWLGFASIIIIGGDLARVATIIDGAFKIAGVIVVTSWALNRYFMARTDVLQLRVDPAVEFVGGADEERMLVLRLDIVNTSRSLTPAFTEMLEVESVAREGTAVRYTPLFRWPTTGAHPAPPIEPGSWSAIDVAIPTPVATRVVRLYVELAFESGAGWTWHRHFVAGELKSENGPCR